MTVLFWLDVSVYFSESIISLALCLIVLGADHRSRINQFFSLFTLGSGVWTILAVFLRLSLWTSIGNAELFGGFAALMFVFMGPALLLFTSRYVKMRNFVADAAAIIGILMLIPLTILLLDGKFIEKHYLDANGTTHVNFYLLSYVASAIPFVFFVWSIVLFVLARKRLKEKYLFMSAVVLLLGMILGALIDVPFPVLSFATITSVVLLGYGVVSRQLFNPLKERNIELQHEIAERKRTEEALRRSESHVKALLAGIPDAIFRLDKNGVCLEYTGPREFDDLLRKDRLIGRSLHDVLPARLAADFLECIRKAIESDEVIHFECPLEIHDSMRYFEARIVKTGEGNAIGIVRDVTRKKELESQLLQSGKMEAIGRIAGGIAHDFNNLLTVMLNYTDLSLVDDHGSQIFDYLSQMKKVILQASELTRQLLAFSRKQVLIPRIVDLNQVIAEMQGMLERLLGEDIVLDVGLAAGLHPVKVDPAQMQQVILNLAVNARDALPGGGKLSIMTENLLVTGEDQALFVAMRPGPYVRLIVRDSGVGMDKETIEHIFEPFFTTKKHHGGTGLGLSTVHGIIMQSSGYIRVTSEPGRGAEFVIVLPASDENESVVVAASFPERVRDVQRTVLVVEDEDIIRSTLVRIMETSGYRVLSASNAREALAIFGSTAGIDLIVSDIMMPGNMSGVDLAVEVRRRHPDMPIILMTGYMSGMNDEQRKACEGIRILHKPFDIHVFIETIRENIG